MKLVLDLPDWQVELLRRAVNVYDAATDSGSPSGIHDVRLVVANAILDATKPKFPNVIDNAQIKRLAEIQIELVDLAKQKKILENEIAKNDKKILDLALAKRRRVSSQEGLDEW